MHRPIQVLLAILSLMGVARAGGNVVASLSSDGTELVVTGSPRGDSICIAFAGVDEMLQLRGVDGTTVNGATTLDFPWELQRLSIDLGAGNDSVRIESLAFAHMDIRLGSGDDSFGFFDAGGPSLRLDLGAGDDSASFEGGALHSLRLSAGRGSDRVRFFAFGIVDRRAFLHGGSGADYLESDVDTFERPPQLVSFETQI